MNPYVIVQYKKIKEGINDDILSNIRDNNVLLDTLIKKYDGFEIRQDGVKTKPVDALTVSTREKLTNDKDEPASNNA